MPSLYKHASPEQVRVLKIVSGAVRNCAHGHPEVSIPDLQKFSRGVAKRAVGTLTAQQSQVLALPSATSGKDLKSVTDYKSGGPAHLLSRSPLMQLWRDISRQLRAIRLSGNIERERAFIDVLKMIAAKQSKPQKGN